MPKVFTPPPPKAVQWPHELHEAGPVPAHDRHPSCRLHAQGQLSCNGGNGGASPYEQASANWGNSFAVWFHRALAERGIDCRLHARTLVLEFNQGALGKFTKPKVRQAKDAYNSLLGSKVTFFWDERAVQAATNAIANAKYRKKLQAQDEKIGATSRHGITQLVLALENVVRIETGVQAGKPLPTRFAGYFQRLRVMTNGRAIIKQVLQDLTGGKAPFTDGSPFFLQGDADQRAACVKVIETLESGKFTFDMPTSAAFKQESVSFPWPFGKICPVPPTDPMDATPLA